MTRNSRKSLLRQWGELLKAVRQTEANLPGVAPFREALEKAYGEALSCQIVRDAARASALHASRRLTESLTASFDAAISLRTFIKSVLGPRTEELLKYGMKPRGRRSVTKKSTIGFEPPN